MPFAAAYIVWCDVCSKHSQEDLDRIALSAGRYNLNCQHENLISMWFAVARVAAHVHMQLFQWAGGFLVTLAWKKAHVEPWRVWFLVGACLSWSLSICWGGYGESDIMHASLTIGAGVLFLAALGPLLSVISKPSLEKPEVAGMLIAFGILFSGMTAVFAWGFNKWEMLAASEYLCTILCSAASFYVCNSSGKRHAANVSKHAV